MPDTVITIESTRTQDDTAPPACLLRWGAREWYATVEQIRQTAEDLYTCAAYADMISELLRIGLPADAISGLASAMLLDRQPRYFGNPDTIYLLPVGDSSRHQGAVALGRRNRFHKGHTDDLLLPDEARAMGRAWLATAEASEADTVFQRVITRAGWMSAPELDALFAVVADVRSGADQ